MKALIAIMAVTVFFVACTRKDEAPAPVPETPSVQSAPSDATPPTADPHAGHDHSHDHGHDHQHEHK